MQYIKEQELGALISSMHKISQRGLPVLLIGAGLPQLVGNPRRQSSLPADDNCTSLILTGDL
jgi:hypothetical protein